VGIDPTAAMLAQCATRTALVARATGTALPLRARSVDVVWMSAVLHHVPDQAACAAEVQRVLRPGGHLLVRGLCPDRSRVAWLHPFPGAARARARFPTAERVVTTFTAGGLTARDAREVQDLRGITRGDAATWADGMRTADTLLTALTGEEIDAGIASLR